MPSTGSFYATKKKEINPSAFSIPELGPPFCSFSLPLGKPSDPQLRGILSFSFPTEATAGMGKDFRFSSF